MSEKSAAQTSVSTQTAARDSALYRGLSWVVTVLVPVALALLAVRMIMNPLFLQVEYNRSGFPPDPYGFTTEDRLHWANIALEYLQNDAGISFLGDLRFEDGSPVYNERELRHMVDVKVTLRATMTVFYVSLGVLVLAGAWAWFGGWWPAYRQGLSRGGLLTVILIATILAAVFVAFGVFFTAFHNVFFQPGTWMFLFSDTLIRLFPERFWQDIFILVGSIALAGGLLLWLGLRKPARRG